MRISDITIDECNDYLNHLGFPIMRSTSNFMQEDDYEICTRISKIE